MAKVEYIVAGAFVAILAVGTAVTLRAPATAAAPRAAWTPPPLPAPLVDLTLACRDDMSARKTLLYAGRRPASKRETGRLCGCIATRLARRFQDVRSAAYAEARLRAMIASDAQGRKIRRLYGVARAEARRAEIRPQHRRGVDGALTDAARSCGEVFSG